MRLSAGISTPSSRGIVIVKKVTKLNHPVPILHYSNIPSLPLALLMTRVLADDAHHVLALHNLARFTKSFY
jgi:hypothetical protein